MRASTKGHLAALFTIIVWAMTFISIKIVLQSFTAMEVTFLRILIAYGALVLFSLLTRKKSSTNEAASHAFEKTASKAPSEGSEAGMSANKKSLRREGLFLLAGFFGVTAYFLLQNIGMAYTTATNTSIILNTVPIFTALLAWLFLKDKAGIHPLFFLGFALAMAGIVIISLDGESAGVHLRGDFLILLASIVWGAYTLITPFLHRYGFSTIRITRHVHFWGLLLMIPVMIACHFRPDPALLLQPKNLLNLLFLGVLASAVCFATWNYAVRQLGSVKSSIYIYGQPIVTVIASALLLHETITPRLLLGILLSFIGVILSGLPK